MFSVRVCLARRLRGVGDACAIHRVANVRTANEGRFSHIMLKVHD